MNARAEICPMSVLIPDGETWDTVKILRCLDEVPAVTVHVLAGTRAPLARFSRYCASCHRHTSEKDEDWIRVMRSLVRRLRIDVILPVTERGVEFASRNRAAILEFAALPPLADYELLMMAQDKWSFHCFASQRGFPVPPSVLVGEAGKSNMDSADIDSVDYPALLKPTLLDGGFGIVTVKDSSDFNRAWRDGRVMEGHRYIVQSYVPGVVFCLGIYSQGGKILAYTLWKTLVTSKKRPFFSARAMEYVSEERIVDLSTRLISAMGWDGIANIDFLLDDRDGTVKIVDFNPRFGQSLLGSLVAGVNFPLLACLGAKGAGYPDMRQQDAVIYAHPGAQGKMLMSRLVGRRAPVRVRWREGSLQFAVRDPLPELVDAARRVVGRFRRGA